MDGVAPCGFATFTPQVNRELGNRGMALGPNRFLSLSQIFGRARSANENPRRGFIE